MLETLKTYSRDVDKFKEIYEEDRFRARVFAFDADPYDKVVTYNNVSPGAFQIYNYTKRYAVSKTLKMYIRKKMESKLIVNKTTFWLHQNRRMFPIMLRNIDKEYVRIFIDHFSWVRFLVEFDIQDMTFNTLVRYKLYSRDKVLRYMFGCPGEAALRIQEKFSYKEWKAIKANIHNIENLNVELLEKKDLFTDTVGMGYKLNKMVNAAWSSRRLKEEHDNWSKEYTDIVFEFNNRNLNIHPVFISLNDFLGGGLIKSTKELAYEGSSQRHCVASYAGQVDKGHKAIFRLNDCTAEIINNGDRLYLNQYNGYRNEHASQELRQGLMNKIEEFNKTRTKEEFSFLKFKALKAEYDPEELPF